MIYGVLIHLEGVLCARGYPLPGSREALISLYAAGIPTRVVSEAICLSPDILAQQMARMGLIVPIPHVFTPYVAKKNATQAALEDLRLPAQAVALIGTELSDIRSGLVAGLQGILLRTGAHPIAEEATVIAQGVWVFDDLDAAIDAIL